jgi:selenocysteine-specific translation elongation factor
VLSFNELVLQRYIAAVNKELAAAREQAKADRAEHLEAAKKLSENLITAAADYVAKQHRASIEEHKEILAKAAASHRQQIAVEAHAFRGIIAWPTAIAGLAALMSFAAFILSFVMWLKG